MKTTNTTDEKPAAAASPPAVAEVTREAEIADIVARALKAAGIDKLHEGLATAEKPAERKLTTEVLEDSQEPAPTREVPVRWNSGVSTALRDASIHTAEGYAQERRNQAFRGQRFMELLHCHKVAQFSLRGGTPLTPVQAASRLFGENHPTTRLASWNPEENRDISSVSSTSAGVLIPPGVAAEFYKLLRPASVVLPAGPRVLPNPTGTLPIPSQDQGATASYLAEGEAVQLSTAGFKMEQATSKRVAAGTLVHEKWMQRVDPATYQTVLDDLLETTALTVDQALLRSTGANAQPKGIRHWAHTDNVFDASNPAGGDTQAEILAKIQYTYNRLVLGPMQANIPLNSGVFFMAPRTYLYLMGVTDGNGNFPLRAELMAGKWGLYPVQWTNSMPVDLDTGTGDESEIIFSNMGDFIFADEEQVRVKISHEVYEADGVARSAMQRDMFVVTVTSYHDFVCRRTKAASVAYGCTWGVPVA